MCSRLSRGRLPRLHAHALAVWAMSTALAASVFPAQAQSGGCQDIGAHLTERKSLVEAIQKLGQGKEKKMDPKAACAAFTKLVANGTTTLKWIEANKEWCQIPDQFSQGIKADHERVTKIRSQACSVAAKQAEMEKKGRSGEAGGLLGGGGLEGTYKMPQGAL